MKSWQVWINLVEQLRPAFSREKTFLWFTLALAGFCCRIDLMGVTSIIRTLGLKSGYYLPLLGLFHSEGVNHNHLVCLWAKLILKFHPGIVYINGRFIAVADGIKKQKSGKKMPGVKHLHQESESNTKSEYIMGHSCQSIGILAKACSTIFCIPLVTKIHEGIIETNRDKRTLMDKLIEMIQDIAFAEKFYLVADAYYGNKKIMNGLLKSGQHLICRARSNAVAFMIPLASEQPKLGRKRKYGKKLKLRELWDTHRNIAVIMDSSVYGESGVKLNVITLDLMVKYCDSMVRFVLVEHPSRGRIMLFSTDTTLESSDIIKIYGYRFKIEVSFKQAVWTIGTFSYRFWMKEMTPTKRNQGNVHIHMKSEEYRNAVKRKLRAYHVYLQVGVIAQGLVQLVAAKETQSVWTNFGSWIRTKRPGVAPSEKVTSVSMRNSLPEFLASEHKSGTFGKFIRDKLDLTRSEGLLFAS